MSEILVLAATGKTGRRVVRKLREEGRSVRAASRSGEVRFDWTDRETWKPAVAGARAVYLVAPDDPTPVREFVSTAGAERYVVLSGRGIDKIGPGFGEGMAEAEQAVRESGAQWTILRPNNFSQNFSEDLWLEPLRTGRLGLPMGETPDPLIDVEDIAEVAVHALTRDGHAGQIYELSGPRGVTYGEAVEIIAKETGRRLEYVELTPEAYRAELVAAGYPEEAVTALDTLFAFYRQGHVSHPADGVSRVLGREARRFEDYVKEVAATGLWSA